MIKRLRRKYIALTMLLLTLVLLAVCSFQAYSYWQYTSWETEGLLLWIADTEQIPVETEENTEPFYSELYFVQLGSGRQIIGFSENLSSDTQRKEVLTKMAAEICDGNQSKGRSGGYRYVQKGKSYGNIVVFAGGNLARGYWLSRDTLTYFAAAGAALAFLLLVSMFLSRFVTKPAEEALLKQKQFISDAGHELKTPLAAISVNADALSAEISANRHLENIRSETARMSALVQKLLALTHLTDDTRVQNRERFNLSDALTEITLPFESIAYERNIHYTFLIPENIYLVGDRGAIQQLAAILLDNAFKYGEAGGEVSMQLAAQADVCILEVYNTGCGISAEALPHIFERFYRADSSRMEDTDSYGLGLAIAQAIVQTQHGQLFAKSENGKWAKFTAIL